MLGSAKHNPLFCQFPALRLIRDPNASLFCQVIGTAVPQIRVPGHVRLREPNLTQSPLNSCGSGCFWVRPPLLLSIILPFLFPLEPDDLA
jgi:hypothetical protein